MYVFIYMRVCVGMRVNENVYVCIYVHVCVSGHVCVCIARCNICKYSCAGPAVCRTYTVTHLCM